MQVNAIINIKNAFRGVGKREEGCGRRGAVVRGGERLGFGVDATSASTALPGFRSFHGRLQRTVDSGPEELLGLNCMPSWLGPASDFLVCSWLPSSLPASILPFLLRLHPLASSSIVFSSQPCRHCPSPKTFLDHHLVASSARFRIVVSFQRLRFAGSCCLLLTTPCFGCHFMWRCGSEHRSLHVKVHSPRNSATCRFFQHSLTTSPRENENANLYLSFDCLVAGDERMVFSKHLSLGHNGLSKATSYLTKFVFQSDIDAAYQRLVNLNFVYQIKQRSLEVEISRWIRSQISTATECLNFELWADLECGVVKLGNEYTQNLQLRVQ